MGFKIGRDTIISCPYDSEDITLYEFFCDAKLYFVLNNKLEALVVQKKLI
jgi:hypothetical protein